MQQQIIDFFEYALSQAGIHNPAIANVVGTFIFLFGELMLLFILISFFVGLLQSYIARDKIQKALTTKYKLLNSFLGAVLGSVTPFCSCSTIPLLVGLRKSGAPFAGMVSFLLTSPILNPVIIIIFFGFFGFIPTLLYAAITLIFAIAVGYTLDKLGFERYFKSDSDLTQSEVSACGCDDVEPETPTNKSEITPAKHTDCCSSQPVSTDTSTSCGCSPTQNIPVSDSLTLSESSCCSSSSKDTTSCCDSVDTSFRSQTGTILERHLKVWNYSFKDACSQFKKILLYLLIGACIGSVIYGFVPQEFLVKVAGEQNPFAVPLAAILGVPMYIRTEAVLPLANLLIGQGVSIGAVVALTIGGAGASIPEISLLSSIFKKQFIVTFILCVFSVAIIAGYAFNILL